MLFKATIVLVSIAIASGLKCYSNQHWFKGEHPNISYEPGTLQAIECSPGTKLCVTAIQRGEVFVQQFGTNMFKTIGCDDYGLCKSGKPGSFDEKGPGGEMSSYNCCSGDLCNNEVGPPSSPASPTPTTRLPAWSQPSQQAQEQRERLDFEVPASQLGELLLAFLDARYERKPNSWGR